MQLLTFSYKLITTKKLKQTKIAAIVKRNYPGGKKLGHAHKILESISNKNIKAQVQKTTFFEPFFDKDFTPSTTDLMKQPEMPTQFESWIMPKTQEVAPTNPKMTQTKVSYCTQKILALIPSTKAYQQKHAVPMDFQQLHTIQGKESLNHFLKYFDKGIGYLLVLLIINTILCSYNIIKAHITFYVKDCKNESHVNISV